MSGALSEDGAATPAHSAPHPGDVTARFDAGLAAMRTGRRADAIAAFRALIGMAPDLPEARVNLGLLLAENPGMEKSAGEHAADIAEAEMQFRAAIALAPWRIEGHLQLGVLLAAQRRFAEAQMCYECALAVDPASPAALSNLGVLLATTGREAQAAELYRTALAIAPDYQPARFNLAYLLLRQGDWEQGWQAFEQRPWYARFDAVFACPRWQGESLAGKSVLIGVEAGHGDMIQFCRYAAQIRQAGAARIGIVCHPGLQRLFGSLDGVDAVIGLDMLVQGTGANLRDAQGWDVWAPPLSLPFRFGTRVDTVPARLPYLASTAADRARLEAMIAAVEAASVQSPWLVGAHARARLRPMRVGLVWQGNPRFENDGARSIAELATLAPLAGIDGVRWFSLQKGAAALAAGAGSASGAHGWLHDLAPALADFADTAAAIDCLDLVIAVDTAVAHLAGALGKPCWLLLSAHQPDWRWLAGREDTPWYPGALRLFRQQGPAGSADWSEVIERVGAALEAQVTARND